MSDVPSWHKQKPLWPWKEYGHSPLSEYGFVSLAPMYRHARVNTVYLYSLIGPWGPDDKYSWIDGSCLVTALAIQGPCALALYKGGKA